MRQKSTILCLLLTALGPCACGGVAPDGDPDASCRVRVFDPDAGTTSVLQVKALSATRFIATAGIDSADPWSVEVEVLPGGALDVDVNVPDITAQELIRDYVMTDDEQLVFVAVPAHTCTEFERSLIYFLIMEWFYFG